VSVRLNPDGTLFGVTDADNVATAGAIPKPVAFFWQVDLRGDGNFTDITRFAAGEIARQEGPTFTPTDAEVGLALRVRAVYQDALGVLEEVYSASQVVGNVNDAPTAGPTISDTTPTEGLALTVDPTTIVDPDGTTTAVAGGLFTFQWQQANAVGVGGGALAGFSNIAGATTQLFVPAQAQVNRELQVVVTYTDDHGTLETIASTPTTVVGNRIIGSNGADVFNGTSTPEATTEGQDIIFGLGGADNISSLGEADIIDGGTGTDTINGGAGNDTINYTMGQGADQVDGGVGTDTSTSRAVLPVAATTPSTSSSMARPLPASKGSHRKRRERDCRSHCRHQHAELRSDRGTGHSKPDDRPGLRVHLHRQYPERDHGCR
jgi:hypothetical protein